jgi:hypothetical protein
VYLNKLFYKYARPWVNFLSICFWCRWWWRYRWRCLINNSIRLMWSTMWNACHVVFLLLWRQPKYIILSIYLFYMFTQKSFLTNGKQRNEKINNNRYECTQFFNVTRVDYENEHVKNKTIFAYSMLCARARWSSIQMEDEQKDSTHFFSIRQVINLTSSSEHSYSYTRTGWLIENKTDHRKRCINGNQWKGKKKHFSAST